MLTNLEKLTNFKSIGLMATLLDAFAEKPIDLNKLVTLQWK